MIGKIFDIEQLTTSKAQVTHTFLMYSSLLYTRDIKAQVFHQVMDSDRPSDPV